MVIEMHPWAKQAIEETERFLARPTPEFKAADKFLDYTAEELQKLKIIRGLSHTSMPCQRTISRFYWLLHTPPNDSSSRWNYKDYYLLLDARHYGSNLNTNNLCVEARITTINRVLSPFNPGGTIMERAYRFDEGQTFAADIRTNIEKNLENILKQLAKELKTRTSDYAWMNAQIDDVRIGLTEIAGKKQ